MVLLSTATHSHCLRHICDNARAQNCGLNVMARKKLWLAAYATNRAEFDQAMAKLRAILVNISLWRRLRINGKVFGQYI